MNLQMPTRFKPVTDFTVQVLVGAFLFSVVFLVAVGIARMIQWAELNQLAPPWVIQIAEYAEMILYGADLAGFVLFLVNELLKLVRGFWLEWKSDG